MSPNCVKWFCSVTPLIFQCVVESCIRYYLIQQLVKIFSTCQNFGSVVVGMILNCRSIEDVYPNNSRITVRVNRPWSFAFEIFASHCKQMVYILYNPLNTMTECFRHSIIIKINWIENIYIHDNNHILRQSYSIIEASCNRVHNAIHGVFRHVYWVFGNTLLCWTVGTGTWGTFHCCW